MRSEYEAGGWERVWQHRVGLGYEFVQDGMSDFDFFWINAYGAMSGLKAGHRGHPFIATCAGCADSVHRNLGPDEKAFNAEIEKRFSSEGRPGPEAWLDRH